MFNSIDHQRPTTDPSAKLGDQPIAPDTPMEPATDLDPAGEVVPPANLLSEAAAPGVTPTTPLSDMDQEDDTAEAEAYARAAAAAPGFEPPTELEVKAEAAAAAHEEEAAQQVATSAIKIEDAETVALLPDPLHNGGHASSATAAQVPSRDASAAELPVDASDRDASGIEMEHSNGDHAPASGEHPADGVAAAEAHDGDAVAIAEAISGPGAAGGALAAAGGSDAMGVAKAEDGADTKQPEPRLPQFLTKDEQRLLDWHWANLEYGCSARLSEARISDASASRSCTLDIAVLFMLYACNDWWLCSSCFVAVASRRTTMTCLLRCCHAAGQPGALEPGERGPRNSVAVAFIP